LFGNRISPPLSPHAFSNTDFSFSHKRSSSFPSLGDCICIDFEGSNNKNDSNNKDISLPNVEFVDNLSFNDSFFNNNNNNNNNKNNGRGTVCSNVSQFTKQTVHQEILSVSDDFRFINYT
jgi:hypothetical protein